MAARSYELELAARPTGLKPMHLSSTVSLQSGHSSDVRYSTLPPETYQDWQLRSLQVRDLQLKEHIRILRIIARALATVCSLATLVPLLMTIVKFLQTKDTYFVVNGVKRTAWAAGTITWYTYMYTAVSAVSFILNLAVMISYLRGGVKSANIADRYSTIWSWATIISHIVTWAVAAGVYRYGKEPVDGKFKDLWGWTCSTSAAALQEVLTSVDFDKYCKVQSSSFYSGIANVAAGILTGILWLFMLLRSRSKKRIRRLTFQEGHDMEPLRG